MQHRYKLIMFSGLALTLLCVFYSWLKPQAAAPTPMASHTSGYYKEPFLLSLQAPENGVIYYTTDGSTPTIHSSRYENGIYLNDRSSEPNHYSAYQNVIRDWQDYAPDSTPVPKGTVVRAVFINNWGVSSEILTQTYFIGISQPAEGYTISLVFEESDLFGDDGLYITGKEYDTWYLSGDISQPAPEPNFNKRIEVGVVAQILDDSGELMSQPVSLRLQGASKRGWIHKRFILEASYNYGHSNLFSAQLFPGISTHSIMTKDTVTDAFVYDFVSDRNVALQKSAPVHVYLNGEFLYSWYILERYDNQFFRQYYSVDDVILVKNGIVDEDVTVDADAYGELMYWVEHTDFSDPAQWEQLNREVDVQSYIDYIAINYYLCNWDFSDYKNHLMWRSTYDGNSPYADKRWRWCIYDIDALELTLDNYAVSNAAEVNIFSDNLPYCDVHVNETVFFQSLRKSPDFCRQFVLSFMDIVNNNFSEARVNSVFEKYHLPDNWMNGYFQLRPVYAAQHLAEEFELTGSLETVTISTNNPEMGSVRVNTSVIDLNSGFWTGRYFTDYPITVTATANEGYIFLGWKGAANCSDISLTLNVNGGITLEAMFARRES